MVQSSSFLRRYFAVLLLAALPALSSACFFKVDKGDALSLAERRRLYKETPWDKQCERQHEAHHTAGQSDKAEGQLWSLALNKPSDTRLIQIYCDDSQDGRNENQVLVLEKVGADGKTPTYKNIALLARTGKPISGPLCGFISFDRAGNALNVTRTSNLNDPSSCKGHWIWDLDPDKATLTLDAADTEGRCGDLSCPYPEIDSKK